jgi:hypothetical protein
VSYKILYKTQGWGSLHTKQGCSTIEVSGKGDHMGEQVKSPSKYTEAQMKYFNQLAQEEQAFELQAEFGKGAKVVNVLTGKVTIVK